MNVMLAFGGYQWTIIPVAQRKTHMDAPEAASVSQDIIPLNRQSFRRRDRPAAIEGSTERIDLLAQHPSAHWDTCSYSASI